MNLKALLYSLLILIVIFLGLFSWSAYSYYETIHSDDPIVPSLTVDIGTVKIVRGNLAYDLTKDESYNLEERDIVETTKDARATITWPDKSLTRLGGGTRIVIEKMLASRSYDQIEIAYDMERGKVWNTIIRTLVGDSYFHVNLPKESVVAGVRGTIFEVNLESRYIHAVDHMTALTDKTGKVLNLLPGELVDSENIWVAKGKEWLDITWAELNNTADKAYKELRAIEIEARLSKLIGKPGISLDNIDHAILSRLSGFEDLQIARLMNRGDIEGLKKYSSDTLLDFYQKIPDITRSDDREKLRKILISDDKNTKIRESLDMHALWDALDRGKLTDGARSYLESKGVNASEFGTKFIDGVKTDTKKLLESLSGSLGTLGF